MDRYLVVSADGHAGLPTRQYRPYLEKKYLEHFDAVVEQELEMGRKKEQFLTMDEVNAEWRDLNLEGLYSAWDSKGRLEVIDGDGVTAEVLFGDESTEQNAAPFGGGVALYSHDKIVPEYQWAGARAHNRFISEFCQDAPHRRIGIAHIPALWDVDEAVKEVHWAKENGLKGVLLPILFNKNIPYHHPRYNPLWQAIQDLDMPIHFHAGPAPHDEYFGDMMAGGWDGVQGAAGVYLSEVGFWVQRPLTFMIWGGVLERYPGLRIAVVEAGNGWVMEYLRSMDYRYKYAKRALRLGDFHSHLSMPPSEYFKKHVSLGVSVLTPDDAKVRHQIGIEKFMWGTDYPHPEGTWPHTEETMNNLFTGIPEAELEAMLGLNAVEFYQLDIDKLLPIASKIGPEKSRFT